jgi:hypothetical protein
MVQATARTNGLISVVHKACGEVAESKKTSYADALLRSGYRGCAGIIAGYRTACCRGRSGLLFDFRGLSRKATLLCTELWYTCVLQWTTMRGRKLLRESASGLMQPKTKSDERLTSARRSPHTQLYRVC